MDVKLVLMMDVKLVLMMDVKFTKNKHIGRWVDWENLLYA